MTFAFICLATFLIIFGVSSGADWSNNLSLNTLVCSLDGSQPFPNAIADEVAGQISSGNPVGKSGTPRGFLLYMPLFAGEP